MAKLLEWHPETEVAERFASSLLAGYPNSLISLSRFNAWYLYRRNMYVPGEPGVTMAGLFDRADHLSVAVAKTRDVNVYL
jgi:hypothetical protein